MARKQPIGHAGSQFDALPQWPLGTVAVLSTGAGPPHAIPISTAVRAGPRTIVLALARRRQSLARLREEPCCALTIMAGGNVAFTAHGRATITEDPMIVSDRVTAIHIDVEAIQHHGQDSSRSTTECGGTGPTRKPSSATPRSGQHYGASRPDRVRKPARSS